MNKIKTITLCVALASCVLASDEHQGEKPKPWAYSLVEAQRLQRAGWVIIMTQLHDAGEATIFAARPNRLLRVPRWNGVNEPPLSMTRALATAKSYAVTTIQTNEQIKLCELTLKKIDNVFYPKETDDRWVYVVTFYKGKTEDNVASWSGDVPVYVLMDGSVIKPRRISRDEPANKTNGE